MKLVRLPSGPLACVYAVAPTHAERGKASGVYRAFSGSVEADGVSERDAIDALDHEVRRLSVPPPPEVMAYEISRMAANDTTGLYSETDIDEWDAVSTGRFRRYSEPETLPAPASSGRGR